MAFNMNGSPLNKLNLFRKGRGKDYRQTKKAIKRQIRKTGGFEATAGADGQFTISGGSGATGSSQSGRTRRQLARKASEHMTAGIDDKAAFGGSDSQQWSGSVGAKGKRTKDYTGDRGGGSYQGTGEKAGVTTTTSNTVDVTGPTVENVQGKISELEKDNPKGISMKSSAFKMKYSPFNQGFGSPLNWNEGGASPLNNLKERAWNDDPLKMQESPLNQTEEDCKSPKVWHKGKCWTASEWETETSTETTDDDLEVTTKKSKRNLERGTEGTTETEDIEAKEGCDKFSYDVCCNKGRKGGHKNNSAGCKKCQSCKAAKTDEEYEGTLQSECKQKGEGWKWNGKECEKVTPGDNETDDQEKLETEVKGTATVITSVTDCPNDGEGYKLVDGKCIDKAAGGVSDTGKARTKKCRCNGKVTGEVPRSKHPQDCPPCDKKKDDKKKDEDCTPKDCAGNRTWDSDKCRCVKGPKVEKEKDKSCKGNKVWSEEKGRCVQKEKEGKEDKPCKCVKYSPRGCNEGDSSPLNQRGECPDNYSK